MKPRLILKTDNYLVSIILVLINWILEVNGYPSGAGLSACSRLMPDHKEAQKPAESTSPYTVEVIRGDTYYSYGKPIISKSIF